MIVIGTRGSKLALVQAHWVSDQLHRHGLANRIEILTTKGDVVQDRFDKMEGKGFFTKEIEDALLAGQVDLAVHSLKDLPTQDAPGLKLAAITRREDPYDVLISAKPLPHNDSGLPNLNGLRVGTSSNRRVASLARLNPQAEFIPIRGNVPTRIGRVQSGEVDVAVLAQAGINRLGWSDERMLVYPGVPPLLVPAPGQGALGLQVRVDDHRDYTFFRHEETGRCVTAERQVLAALDGGCQLPLGVFVRSVERKYQMDLFLGAMAGHPPMVLSLTGKTPENLAEEAIARIRAARP